MMKKEKLLTLPPLTKLKKISLTLEGVNKGIIALNDTEIDDYLAIIASTDGVDKETFSVLQERYKNGERLTLITHYLNVITKRNEADWDWIKDNGALDKDKRIVNDIYLVLDEIRSPYNLGSIFRSAESFKVKKIYILGNGASPLNQKAVRSSCGCVDVVEWEKIERCEFFNLLKNDKTLSVIPIYALECGGEDINKYNFSNSGIIIVGNEEFGVSRDLLSISSQIISIPLYGSKGSINVSMATAILLQKWSSLT